MRRRLWILSLLLALQMPSSHAAYAPQVKALDYHEGQPVVIHDAPDVATITVTGPVTFANPTGIIAPEQRLLIKVQADKHYPVSWDSAYQPRYGWGLPLVTTGNGTIDAWEFVFNPLTRTMDLEWSSQPVPRLATCALVATPKVGQYVTEADLTKVGLCTVPGTALVVEVHLRIDGGTPAITPNKQLGSQAPEALVATPLTPPTGTSVICVRAQAAPGLAGSPCQAGLQHPQIPAGDWQLGMTGKPKGNTKQAVLTIYYWTEQL